jgi:HEAT repeat protein
MDLHHVLDLLKTGDAGRRLLAARELRRWNGPEAKAALAEALGDPAREVRDAASRTLMEIGDAPTVRLIVPLLRSGTPEVRNGARQVLERLCRIEPAALLDLARDGDVRMRVFAANIMGGTGDHDFTPSLLAMLGDAEANVVEAACAALGQLGTREAVPGLSRLAAAAEPWLRFSAIDALGRIPDPSAARALLDLVAGADPDFLEPIVDALGRQGSGASVIPLVGLIDAKKSLRPALLKTLLGPLAPQVAALGRDPRLQPLARAAAAALDRNELPSRIASTTAVLLAGIGADLSRGGREDA